jgi:hypothetical protein
MQHPVLLHQRFQGQSVSLLTADELYWDKIIKRKYQTSLDFYALLKHMAVDCRSNLVLNVQSAQDTHLTCYEYPRHAIQLRVGDGGEPVQCGGLS